jgi:hypothetical protein
VLLLSIDNHLLDSAHEAFCSVIVRPAVTTSASALNHSCQAMTLTRPHTRSMIYGIRYMELRELVEAILRGDLLSARQWVADARRKSFHWQSLPRPRDFSDREMTVAAGLVELLAYRSGVNPPSWTAIVGPEPEPLLLGPGLDQMPRSYARAKSSGPAPLRKRNLVALPDFLDVA